MSNNVNEWIFCTEHRKAVDGGSCDECNGDRNLVQVVRRYYLDVARNQVGAEREACAKLVDESAAKVRGTSNWWGALLDGIAARIRERGEAHWVAMGDEGTRELLRRLDAVRESEDRKIEIEDILRQAYPVLRQADMWSLVDRIDALKL